MTQASTASTYRGSCHCGAVRFTAEADLSQPVVACNCSMCGRSGTLLCFVPSSKLTLEQGAESLTDYQFHKRHIHHLFCKVCGIKPFARGTAPGSQQEMIALNVRCLEGVELANLQIRHVDGRSF